MLTSCNINKRSHSAGQSTIFYKYFPGTAASVTAGTSHTREVLSEKSCDLCQSYRRAPSRFNYTIIQNSTIELLFVHQALDINWGIQACQNP